MKSKKKGKKVIRIMFFLGVVICLGASINWAYHYLTSSPYFNITQVKIGGIKYLDRGAVQRFLGLQRGINIFSLDLKDLNQRLSMHQWIKDGLIRRAIPDKIIISIVERTPVAAVYLGAKFFVAEDGQILTPLKKTEGLQLPLITGVGGQEGIKSKLKKGVEVLMALHTTSWMTAKDIAKLDVSLIERPRVVLKEKATEIRLSFHNLKQNLSYLHTILPFIEKEKEEGKVSIDLSFKDLAIVKTL